MNYFSILFLAIFITFASGASSEEALQQKPVVLSGIERILGKHSSSISDDCKIQIQCALDAFNTVKAKKIVYVSTPITSGKRLYDYMDANGYKTLQDVRGDREAFFQHVVSPNIEKSERVSSALSKQVDGVVIAPTAFENGRHSQKLEAWGQHEFMSMWLSLIDQKVTNLVMLDGWQYSNGSGEEYLWAAMMQMGFAARSDIEIVDEQGTMLNLDKGIKLLYDAFTDVHSRGLKPKNMAETLAALIESEQCYFNKSHSDHTRTHMPAYDRTEIKTIADELHMIFAKDYPELLIGL